VKEVLVSLIVAAVAAFAVGAIVSRRWRRIGFLATLAGPLLVYTWWLAVTPSGGDGFWGWWITGITMGGIPFLLSCAASMGGFYMGRTLGRSAGIE
jgi:hypothetical protein